MRAQTDAAVADADIVLFLVDARAGVLPLDERFADLLRRTDKPVVLAANKHEGKASEGGYNEAYALGFGEPIALSGEHGIGMSELFAAIAQYAPEPEPKEAEDEANRTIKIAIIGRPNAGKSTLANALLGSDRMLTGPEAGITRDAISVDWEHNGQKFRLVDTAGMRRKAKVQDKLEKLSVAESLHAIRFADICILMMDATQAFEKQDLVIADLVEREGRGLVFCLSKWDQISTPRETLEEFKLVAQESVPQTRGAPIITVAALAGIGLDRLMNGVMRVHKDWTARVKTSDINNWMKAAIERHPPPAVHGRRIKPRYITQIKTRPPTFVLMCSRASELPESYRRYLVNGIREAFELMATPVRLTVRQNRNPYNENEGD
jgi:GTP-binding protein